MQGQLLYAIHTCKLYTIVTVGCSASTSTANHKFVMIVCYAYPLPRYVALIFLVRLGIMHLYSQAIICFLNIFNSQLGMLIRAEDTCKRFFINRKPHPF